MSNEISLQADVGNVPNNAVAVLSSISPFIQAVSADNVSPLAVVQVEAIGSCFHLNGELAAKVPDLLSRSTSYRLERLSHWIGWRAGDTASYMAQTAGGRAASVLSLALIELYKEEATGNLLYELSSKILPSERNQSSKLQIGQVATNLSRKLAAFGFGNHLAFHVTRVREVYLYANLPIPKNLLVFPTVETMAEFLHCLSRALQEEQSMLYFEGCQGVGYMLAIVMALCPEDALVTIENEVVLRGPRQSVVFAIRSESPTQFSIESIIYGGGTRNNPHVVGTKSTGPSICLSPISLKWDGCLSDTLDLAFINVGAASTVLVRTACVELITSILYSLSGSQLYSKPNGCSLPANGFAGLLGPDSWARVRNTLTRIFNCEPSFTVLPFEKAHDDLRAKVAESVSLSICTCDRCFTGGPTIGWGYDTSCKGRELWRIIDALITRGVVACFVTAEKNTCIRLSIEEGYRSGLLRKISTILGPRPDCPPRPWFEDWNFGVVELHAYILDLVSKFKTMWEERNLGISSGASSIFASTLQNPVFQSPRRLEYILADGQFHDDHNSYHTLIADNCSTRPITRESLTSSPIISSSLGVHNSLLLTARGVGDQVKIRTLVQMSSKTATLDFYKLHVAYMSVNIATTCLHNPREPLSRNPVLVITTSVLAPGIFQKLNVTSRDRGKSRKELRNPTAIAMVLTHKNAEAQFLACVKEMPMLFQGFSCLDCSVKEAYELGLEVVIQS